MVKGNDEIITLKEVAELTRYKIGYLYQVYHLWPARGVRIIKAAPNARPRFYRSEIIRMMESPK